MKGELFEGHAAVLHAVGAAVWAWVGVGDGGDDCAAGEAFVGVGVGGARCDVKHCGL